MKQGGPHGAQAHLRQLVVLILALWNDLSQKQIAGRTRMTSSRISQLLTRERQRPHVERRGDPRLRNILFLNLASNLVHASRHGEAAELVDAVLLSKRFCIKPHPEGGGVLHRAIVIAILLIVLPAPALAECQICFKFFDDEWCYPAKSGESGVTNCTNPEEASCCCSMGGSPCTGGSGGAGGGGGGGWGGGGGACSGSGFCPAECFSCGGGGSV